MGLFFESPTEPPRRRARVLLSAYAISPFEGGECYVGWNRMLQAARCHDVWVLYGKRKSATDLAIYFDTHPPIPGVTFVHEPMTPGEERLANLGGAIPYNLAYRSWQRRMLSVARDLHRQVDFDLVHQAVFCGFREPGYLWKLGLPFVWGPVGGTDSCPPTLRWSLGWRAAVAETVRAWITAAQLRFSRRLREVAHRAAVCLAANSQVQQKLQRTYGRDVQVLLETGLRAIASARIGPRPHSELRLLWSGHFNPTKALHLLLAALARLPAGTNYRLRVLGDGVCRARWESLARKLGVAEHIEWRGWQEHSVALTQLEWADVMVFTSLRDTSGNVALEALGSGLPVVCLDHQGMHDIVTAECGVKIPVGRPQQVVTALTQTLTELAQDRRRVARLSAGALARAHEYLWSHNGDQLERIYQQALTAVAGRLQPTPDTDAAIVPVGSL